jgi:hypothetical protein
VSGRYRWVQLWRLFTIIIFQFWKQICIDSLYSDSCFILRNNILCGSAIFTFNNRGTKRCNRYLSNNILFTIVCHVFNHIRFVNSAKFNYWNIFVIHSYLCFTFHIIGNGFVFVGILYAISRFTFHSNFIHY